MNYGLQISASGVMAALYRQDVLTNNLANLDSVGFKADIPATYLRPAAREEDGVHWLPSNGLLEKLGAGVLLAPNRVDFTQGSLEANQGPLDLAIQGEGFFLVRSEMDGTSDRLRLTRDGRFSLDSRGRLVMASLGLPVLDIQNRPITLSDPKDVTIEPDGTVRQGDAIVARIQVTQVPDTGTLAKEGHSLFLAPNDALANRTPARGRIRQHAIERSGVDEVRAILEISSAAREVEANVGLMQQHDRMMERAINTLGRVV